MAATLSVSPSIDSPMRMREAVSCSINSPRAHKDPKFITQLRVCPKQSTSVKPSIRQNPVIFASYPSPLQCADFPIETEPPTPAFQPSQLVTLTPILSTSKAEYPREPRPTPVVLPRHNFCSGGLAFNTLSTGLPRVAGSGITLHKIMKGAQDCDFSPTNTQKLANPPSRASAQVSIIPHQPEDSSEGNVIIEDIGESDFIRALEKSEHKDKIPILTNSEQIETPLAPEYDPVGATRPFTGTLYFGSKPPSPTSRSSKPVSTQPPRQFAFNMHTAAAKASTLGRTDKLPPTILISRPTE